MDTSLVRLIYTSRATAKFSDGHLIAMLVQARDRNRDRAITGLLLHDAGWFAQWVEGPRPSVEELWSGLRKDDRHENVQLISAYSPKGRAFPRWEMGFAADDPQLVRRLQGIHEPVVGALREAVHNPEQVVQLFEKLSQQELSGSY